MQSELEFESLDVEDYNLVKDSAPIKIRDYQEKCFESIEAAWKEGINSGLIVLSTGLGKTVIAAHLPRYLKTKKVLFLAHREELINQASAALRKALPDLRCGIEQADRCVEDNVEVVVGSVQTLGRRWKNHEEDTWNLSRRLERFSNEHFDIVIIDEAHRAVGRTYLRILKHLKAGTEDGPFLLGITATPERSDRVPLANVFEKVLYEKTLKPAISEGWLKRIHSIKVKSIADISSVNLTGRDFNEQELAERINVDNRNSLIYSAIEDHAHDRKCILIFCINIAHAEAVANQLSERGIDATFVHSKISLEERRERLNAWRKGDVRVMTNVGVLTEGFDLPRIDCIIMARPTMSRLLYMQMLGRATRHCCPKCFSGKLVHLNEEKPITWSCYDCGYTFPSSEGMHGLVIDIADVCGRHRPVSANEVFGIRDIDLLGEDLLNVEDQVRRAEELGINIDEDDTIEDVNRRTDLLEGIYSDIKYIETESEAVDLFDSFALPDDVLESSIFPWLKVIENGFQLNVEKGNIIKLWKTTLGEWKIRYGVTTEVGPTQSKIPWKWADRMVKRALAERVPVSDTYSIPKWRFIKIDAGWRKKPPTAKQIDFLYKLGVHKIPHNLNRGDAKLIIDGITSNRKRRRFI